MLRWLLDRDEVGRVCTRRPVVRVDVKLRATLEWGAEIPLPPPPTRAAFSREATTRLEEIERLVPCETARVRRFSSGRTRAGRARLGPPGIRAGMPIVDTGTGARVEEVADRLYQIHLPVPGDGFSFNQYLLDDDEPLLFHTGPRRAASLVLRCVASVVPLQKLRWVGYSHCESDECGAMAELLAAAPQARPVTGATGAMLNGDLFDRPTLGLRDGEALPLGRGRVTWLDAPHLPHGWECGYLFEEHTRTLLCGDLFTQPGARGPAVTTADVLGPSERLRAGGDYFFHAPDSRRLLEKLAATRPALLACMHGSAWQGEGNRLLLALADALQADGAGPDRAAPAG